MTSSILISSSSLKRALLGGALLAAGFLAAGNAQAQTNDSWTGGNTGSWATSTNWSMGTPVSGDSLTFYTRGTQTDNLMTPSTYTVAGITFGNSGKGLTIAPATAGTNGFTLTNGIADNLHYGVEIDDMIVLSGAITFTNTSNSGLKLAGGMTDSNPLSPSNITVTGPPYQIGADVAFGGTNTLGGSITVSQMVLQFNDSSSTYGGNLSVSGTGTGANAGSIIFEGASDTFNGTLTIGAFASATISDAITSGTNPAGTYSDAISVASGSTLNGNLSTGTQTLSGVISGAGNVTQEGAGTTVLSNANIYTGGTAVTAGTLLVDTATGSGSGTGTGTGAVTVGGGSSAATLGGTGSVVPGIAGTPGTVTVNANGVVAPGDSTVSPTGTLTIGSATVASNLTFAATTASFTFALNTGLQSSQVNVFGTLTFNLTTANFNDVSSGLLTPGLYALTTSGSESGLTFNGTATDGNAIITGGLTVGSGLSAYTGAGDTAQLEYDSTNDTTYLDLMANAVVPDPSTWALLIVGGAFLFLWERKRGKLFRRRTSRSA